MIICHLILLLFEILLDWLSDRWSILSPSCLAATSSRILVSSNFEESVSISRSRYWTSWRWSWHIIILLSRSHLRSRSIILLIIIWSTLRPRYRSQSFILLLVISLLTHSSSTSPWSSGLILRYIWSLALGRAIFLVLIARWSRFKSSWFRSCAAEDLHEGIRFLLRWFLLFLILEHRFDLDSVS